MRSSLQKLITLTALLTAVAATSYAEGDWVRLEETAAPPDLSLGSCQVGNTIAPNGAELSPTPFESCLLVDPADDCPSCGAGVQFSSINVYISDSGFTFPCEVSLRAKVREVQPSGGCDTAPGDVICEGNTIVQTLTEQGTTSFALPVQCPCAQKGFLYFLCVEVVDRDCDRATSRTAAFLTPPDPCTNFWITSTGFLIDEVNTYIPGDLSIFANTACCDVPIPIVPESWGGVKSQFE